MRKSAEKKRKDSSKVAVCDELDTHNWENKMEIHRLITGKADLEISRGGKSGG